MAIKHKHGAMGVDRLATRNQVSWVLDICLKLHVRANNIRARKMDLLLNLPRRGEIVRSDGLLLFHLQAGDIGPLDFQGGNLGI